MRLGRRVGPEMACSEIDRVRLDRCVRVVKEDRDDRIEPDALPVPAGQQAGPDPSVVDVIDKDAGPAQPIQLVLPTGLVGSDVFAQLLVLVK